MSLPHATHDLKEAPSFLDIKNADLNTKALKQNDLKLPSAKPKKWFFDKPTEGRTFRKSLPPIETYQQALTFHADAPGRVILRLERLMGTSNIRPIDINYMKTLRGKLEQEEKVKWEGRFAERSHKEYDRCRKLVINGHSAPPPGMEDIYKHPVFRVNRIMNRLVNIDQELDKEFHVKPPPIQQVEPFQEYQETGFLFGHHPGHYLKVKPEEVTAEDLQPHIMFHSRQFDGNGKLLPPQVVPPSPKPSEPIGIQPLTRPHSPQTHSVLPKSKQKYLLEDIEAAKTKYGINPDDIEKMWKEYDSPLIKLMDKEEESTALFNKSEKILETGQRRERFGQTFINRTHRQLFNS